MKNLKLIILIILILLISTISAVSAVDENNTNEESINVINYEIQKENNIPLSDQKINDKKPQENIINPSVSLNQTFAVEAQQQQDIINNKELEKQKENINFNNQDSDKTD